MAESSSQKSTHVCEHVGVLLTPGISTEFDPMKCIICQEFCDKTTKTTQPKEAGRDSMKRAASIRKDVVSKRLKRAEEEGTPYVYHNTNKCFKWYTHMQKLKTLEQAEAVAQDVDDDMEVLANESTKPMLRRSSVTPREAASCERDPELLKCVVCGSDRVQVNRVSLRDKFRISQRVAAHNFLTATKHLKDEVFCRVAELSSVEDVFASDVYCHAICIRRYLHKYEQDVQSSSSIPIDKCNSNSAVKQTLFLQALENIEPLLQEGYGFTVKDITSCMYHLDDTLDFIIYNRDVKILLEDHYGDRIQFAPNPRRNESELVFSSNITAADLAIKIKNLDAVRQVGESLNKAAKQVDYGLDDKFCDAEELKHSLENTLIPDEWLTFYSALYDIPKSLMAKIEMMQMPDEEEHVYCDDGEDTLFDEEDRWAMKNRHSKLNCHFQMTYNHIHHGRRKTPLHTMLGQYMYGKTRSREILTTLNRVGTSASYNEVKRSRCLMCAYTIQSSEVTGVPIPSHFSDDGWAFGAFDNEDFEDNSSISGTQGKHYTGQALYQETTSPAKSKPSVSSTNLSKFARPSKEKLPCQIVPSHHKPVVKPTLPPNFRLVENIDVNILSDAEEAVEQSANTEFLISLIRCGLPYSAAAPGELPPWGGIHALVTTANVPLMRVGFLPVIPSPVTDYATVRKALTNFQASRRQLNQDTMAIVSDEGVYHIVVDIVMSEPDTFNDLFPMLGMFHFAKVLLRCAGRYLCGSGMSDALIGSEVFGPKTVSTVLSGGHYVRSLTGMLIVSEVLDSLMWNAFWQSNDHTSVPFVQSAIELKDVLQTKKREGCVPKFEQVSADAADLRQQFNTFVQGCQEKSELCHYFMNFRKIVAIIKQLIVADRDGNWPLHVGTVKASMGILREFDAINYLRYASWYLERIQVLEVTYPTLYRRFCMGQFVVKDRPGAVFAAVAGDMKLEQSQNRFSQGPGGHVIVGSAGDAAVVAEFGLLFHEILAISNLLQLLTNARLMDHLETTIQHELGGRKGLIFDRNVTRLLECVKARENPFIVLAPNVPLYNIVTKHIVNDIVKARLLKALENGDIAYRQFRNERYVVRSKKLSVTISKVKLPAFDAQCTTKTNTVPTKTIVSTQDITSAQREAEIAILRGMSPEELYSHDLLQSSQLFVGDITTKPDKAKLVTELETNLTSDDYQITRDSPQATHVLLDFMSKIRQFPNLRSISTNFGGVIQEVLKSARRVCPTLEMTHIVFDSYNELSIKEGERNRRAGENCGGVEAFLLAVYNLETCTADGKPKAKSFRIPTLSQHSIYHEPQLLSNTPLTEAALSHINLEPAEFKDGPHPQYESINGQNRHAILSRLLQCYYGDIANLSARSHRFLCKMCSRIVTTGFSNLSQPEDANDDDATQAANLAEVLRRTSCSGEMLSRIAVSPTLLIDMLSCLYFTMFNGQPGPASQAIVDIHHRASYELYADVLLVTNAIRNTLRESPSGHPDDGPIGISLALSPASSNYALSKTAITNASFRARKLPDDIPLVQSDEPQAKLPTIEEDGDPGGKTKGLKAKLAKKDKAEKSRLKESRSSDMVPAGILNGDVTDSVQVQVSRSGQKRSIADNIEMSSFNKNTIHNTNKDDNDVFSQPHSGKHNSPAGKTGTAMKNSVSNKDIKNAKMASIGHTRSGSAESTGSEHLSTDL